jgi:hypothetical protein
LNSIIDTFFDFNIEPVVHPSQPTILLEVVAKPKRKGNFKKGPRTGNPWGDGNSPATQSLAPVVGHYYGQRSSATSRTLYLNASAIGSSSANVSVTGISDQTIQIMNRKGDTFFSDDTCGVAYLTDGTLTQLEITNFHTALNTYLISATGK